MMPVKVATHVTGTLIFAYTPVEDPEVYRKVWDEFLAHLTKTTGKKAASKKSDRGAARSTANQPRKSRR